MPTLRLRPARFVSLLLLAGTASAQWTVGPSFPDTSAGRRYAAGLEVDGLLLAIGGSPFDGNPDAAVHGIVPGDAAWTAYPHVEGPVVRQGAGVDVFGNVIVFGGVDGLDPDGDLGKAYRYDLVEGQQGGIGQRSSLAPNDLFAWATDADGRIYSLGGGAGASATAGSPNSTRVERYDAVTNTWSPVAPLPAGVADAAGVFDGAGRILVIGGFDALGSRTSEVASYTVATDSWSTTALPDAPVAVSGARAVLGADDRIYLIGGSTAAGVTDGTWVLDLAQESWAAGPSLATPRQHFAAALASDDHVWAMGGDDGASGTWTVERLYTPPCPDFPLLPAPVVTWEGMRAALTVAVDGGTPLGFSWTRDGQPVVDGVSAGGAVISGATTPSLVLDGVGPADAGDYRLVATNPCGERTSPALALDVLSPPTIGAGWKFESLHPPGALSSTARSVDGFQVGGGAAFPDATYGSLEHPYLWSVWGDPALDLTPAGSVGGSVNEVDGGVQVGWYWWPYSTPQGTAYERHAAHWSGSAASHFGLHQVGWEYGSASDTDGAQVVGTMTFDDTSTTSDGVLWQTSSSGPTFLTPAAAWGSSCSAVFDGVQYGNVNLGFGVVHAARWSGSAASFVDLDPAGSSWSYVLGAGLGQRVGRATFGGVHHAALWGDDAESFVDLHPTGATSSEARAVDGGLQLGRVTFPGGSMTVLWSGSADEYVDLGALADPRFTSVIAYDVDVDADGTIRVAGYGYDPVAMRSEAVLWTHQTQAMIADGVEASLSAGGTQRFALAADPAFAGELYWIFGSATGTAPGIDFGGVLLPLNYDPYFQLTWSRPFAGVFTGFLGLLGDDATAEAAFNLPAGADPGLAGLTLHHAFTATTTFGLVELASNAVPLQLVP